MKNVYLLITIIIALLLSACGSQATATPIPTLVLDGNNPSPSNGGTGSGNSVSAAANIVPAKTAKLSFATIGHVTEVNVEVGDTVSAGDVLARLDTTILEAKIREAQANLELANIQVRYLKRIGTNQPHLETAIADVDRAQALLDLANANLDAQSVLVAPMNGTVISVDTAPAEVVTPGQVVVTLANLSYFQVETTDLSERDVTKVQIGQPANVFIEALGEEFTGKVVDVDRIGSTLGGDVVFTVTIYLDKQPQGLLWGMSADVNIETNR
jgi:RND family efflux transporter MFP subunit